MSLIAGILLVTFCTLGGYAAMGGHIAVLWQPFEFVIIFGSGCGAYVIGNSGDVLRRTFPTIKHAFKGARYKKENFTELLCLMYQISRQMRAKGAGSIEADIDDPENSSLFASFPILLKDKSSLHFLCDYLRIMTLGPVKAHEIEALMEEDVESIRHYKLKVASALQTMADGMPALGIVAAVLGVIKTMASISEPPEILGHLIGGALVGTFLGVWIAYGFVSPTAQKAQSTQETDLMPISCIKAALIAHINEAAPAIVVEYARKNLEEHLRPDFAEIEELLSQLPAVAQEATA